MGTSSSSGPELPELLHRLRSTLARLKGQVELAELDGHPFADEVTKSIEEAVARVGELETRVLPTLTVAVVDDDVSVADVVAARLRHRGWRVSTLYQLDANSHLPHFVLIDYGLLVSLSQEVKKSLLHSNFVVMSGANDVHARLDSLRLGALGFVLKPIDYDELDRLFSHSVRATRR